MDDFMMVAFYVLNTANGFVQIENLCDAQAKKLNKNHFENHFY